jgi:S-formylglutathione hydrolase
MASGLEIVSETACFGGTQGVYAHDSAATGTRMTFSVYLPPQASERRCPVVYYLSGLTCTWENATTKAGFQRGAAQHGLIVVAPDTSPRGEDVADDEAYDLGQGAGFYVDATERPWAPHFAMWRYVTSDLPGLIEAEFPVTDRRGITGHSMGGHGALTAALKLPERYQAVSAFAPIVAPSQVPWGEKAFTAYLGEDRSTWAAHDAAALVAEHGYPRDVLIDQGEADNFLSRELRPELFREACSTAGVDLTLRLHPGYDHSYYFVASFMDDHLAWHAERLAV